MKTTPIRACGVIEIDWTLPEGISIEQAVQNAEDALVKHFAKHGLRFHAEICLDNAYDRNTGENLL